MHKLRAAVLPPILLLASCGIFFTTPLEVIRNSPKATSICDPDGLEVSITFNREVERIRTEEAFSLTSGGIEPPGRIEWEENKLIFSPYKDLNQNSEYLLTVSTRAEDLAGNSLTEDFTLTFRTGREGQRPNVTSVSPAPFSNISDPLCPVEILFDQEIDRDSILAGFAISPVTSGISTLSTDGLRFTFTPAEELKWQKDYSLTISENVCTTAGRALDEEYCWSFRVGSEEIPPDLISASSADKSVILTPSPLGNPSLDTNTGWEKDGDILLVFSEEVDKNSTESAVTIEPAVPFTISWDDEMTPSEMVISWDENLEWKKLYRLSLSTALKDLQGNNMEEQKIYYLYVDGVRSRPPALCRVNLIPDQAAVVTLFDAQTPANGCDSDLILDTTVGDALQSPFYIDYYFALAETAELPFFGFILNYLISPDDSCISVTYLNFQLFNPGAPMTPAANPKPVPGAGQAVVRLICSVTDSKSTSGRVLFQVFRDLKDSLGNRMETDWRMELFDEDN
ncbi:MAG: Ig-like domain-containing protein [Spirochaetales bacterium]|nr:Ig-like domain-containing protein [Spirochaetales bacterium]